LRLLRALAKMAYATFAPRWPRPTSCDRLLARVLEDLGPALAAAGGGVHGGSLPTVRADERQLERVFRALIGNALAHRGAEPPFVHVSARPAGREWLFSVRDNGTGVEPARHHLIFNPLSGAGELPACRRIVERHGGRMWVESARGHGATFHFSLPATREAEHA
jgi:signal transduction histidine kinase